MREAYRLGSGRFRAKIVVRLVAFVLRAQQLAGCLRRALPAVRRLPAALGI
jgi:hypothetical protein